MAIQAIPGWGLLHIGVVSLTPGATFLSQTQNPIPSTSPLADSFDPIGSHSALSVLLSKPDLKLPSSLAALAPYREKLLKGALFETKVLPLRVVPGGAFAIQDLKVHPDLEGLSDGTILPLPDHYAKLFSKGARGAGRIYKENLGTAVNVKGFSLVLKAPEGNSGKVRLVANPTTLEIDGHPIVAKDLINNPDPFAKNPDDVDIVLLGLHGATHPEKSLGASLLTSLGIIEQRAKEKGIRVVSIIPDLPLHGLGPVDLRLQRHLHFYLAWLTHILREIHNAYPKARTIIHGRSTGANAVLALAYGSNPLRELSVRGIFADSPYPPGTMDAQDAAIHAREADLKKKDPRHLDYKIVEGSEPMLRAYDADWSFWNRSGSPLNNHFRLIVRIGRKDDNAVYNGTTYYNQEGMWSGWSKRTGVHLKIDNGQHDALGGFQKNGDPEVYAIADSNADDITGMMEMALENNLHWRRLDKRRKRQEFKEARSVQEGLENSLRAARNRYEETQAVLKRVKLEITQLDEDACLTYKLVEKVEQGLADQLIDPANKFLLAELKDVQRQSDAIYEEIFRLRSERPDIEKERHDEIARLKHRIRALETLLKERVEGTPLESAFAAYQQVIRTYTEIRSNARRKEKTIPHLEKNVADATARLKKSQATAEIGRKKVEEAETALRNASQAYDELRAKKERRRLANKRAISNGSPSSAAPAL